MKSYDYVFFDLDGTLTDSGPGIANGFCYAIEQMGGQVEDRAMLKQFVGPPLRDSFEKTLGYSPDDATKAIAYYREYYHQKGGIFENTVYPGIPELLRNLKEQGKKLVVATSKSARGTEEVLEHFGLKKYFDFIATSNDTDRIYKVDVICYALDQCSVKDLSKVIMVGDRNNDVSAAREIGMDSIGVLYGYGDAEELTNGGATYLAEKVEDIAGYIS